jgi:hypothetical protein
MHPHAVSKADRFTAYIYMYIYTRRINVTCMYSGSSSLAWDVISAVCY